MDTNFKGMASKWKSQSGAQPLFTSTLLQQKSPKSLLDKVHQNMRLEFRAFLLLLLIGAFTLYSLRLDGLTKVLCWVGIVVVLFVMLIYMSRFYRFYRSSRQLALDTYESLLWLYYELKLGIEVYRSFSLTCFLVGLTFGFIIGSIEGAKSAPVELFNPDKLVLTMVFSLIGTFGLLWAFIEWWIHHAYGRHLKLIFGILTDLKESAIEKA